MRTDSIFAAKTSSPLCPTHGPVSLKAERQGAPCIDETTQLPESSSLDWASFLGGRHCKLPSTFDRSNYREAYNIISVSGGFEADRGFDAVAFLGEVGYVPWVATMKTARSPFLGKSVEDYSFRPATRLKSVIDL